MRIMQMEKMRSEREMYDLILHVAQEDERIRVVGLNGSRTNRLAPVDCFQDYDVVYLVTDMASFMADHSWVDVFGEPVIKQLPDTSSLFPAQQWDQFAYLMLFTDGNRIDLTLMLVEHLEAYLADSTLTQIILDKDERIETLPEPSDRDYWVTPPTAANYADCCNEFWWVSTYIAKGLCRHELLYASFHMERCVRFELLRMLKWRAGICMDFEVTVGKCEKYLRPYMTEEEWSVLMKTYVLADEEHCREALYAAWELFRIAAKAVGEHFGYAYSEEDERVSTYIDSLFA